MSVEMVEEEILLRPIALAPQSSWLSLTQHGWRILRLQPPVTDA